jgi:hypothetical protein
MKQFVLLFFFAFSSIIGSATHLKGGYISIKRISGLTCDITVTVFTDSNCTDCVLFGSELSVLNFGDGSSVFVPETPTTSVPRISNAGMATHTVRHTYPGIASYTVFFSEPGRNTGVINMSNSTGTTFYFETIINFDPMLGFHSTPEFLVGPVFEAKLGTPLSWSLGVSSDDDLIISYELGTPYQDKGIPVLNYKLPENFTINPHNGLITWDTKFEGQYHAGEYTFNVKIRLYKKINDILYSVCTTSRDVQIILTEGASDIIDVSSNTIVDENGRIYLPPNESKTIKVFYKASTDPSNIQINAYSELNDTPAFAFSSYDSSTDARIKVGVLTFIADPSFEREQPYLIIVRGNKNEIAHDVSYLFFMRDLQPEIITGIDEELDDIGLYPNPATDFITVSIPVNRNASISVRDQMGNLVNSVQTTGKTILDVRHLGQGIYYCTILTRARIKTLKFIKQ